MHHRHLVERPGRLLCLCIFLRLPFELLHQTMVLHLHLLCVAGTTLDGVFHHRLPLELLRPARHRDRRRMAFMRLIAWSCGKQPRRRHQTAGQQDALQHQRQPRMAPPACWLKHITPHHSTASPFYTRLTRRMVD